MRKWICAVLLLLILPVGPVFAAEATADGETIYQENMDQIIEQLPDSVAQYLEADEMRQEGSVINAFLSVVNNILGDFKTMVKDPVMVFGMLCAVLVLCAAASFYTQSNTKLSADATVTVVGALAVSGTVSAVILTAVNAALDTVAIAEQFVAGFIPVFAGIMVSSGQITSAAMWSAGLLGAAGAASSVISLFIKPLTGVMLGLSLVSGIHDSGMTSAVTGIKKTVMWVLGIVTSLFVGLMGLQGAVSAQSDNLALRTTKYLVGSSIPVIGSSVSEAVTTVSSSFQVIRGTVGSAGIITLCGIFLPELVRLLLCSVAMSFAATVGDMIGSANLARSIRSVRAAIDIITAVLSFYFIALSVCTAIMINAGGS